MIKATAIYIIALCLFAPLRVVAQQLDCSLARPNPERLTASSGSFFGDVTIVGMNDNGPITGLSITITGVRQDEDPDEDYSPSASYFSFIVQLVSFIFNILFGWLFFPGGFPGNDNSQGGRLLADAVIDGSLTSLARQRDPDGNGRVYTLYFLARDISNNSCQGTVTVCIPNGNSCVDDGPTFDSLSSN